MKKIITIFLIIFLLCSCSSSRVEMTEEEYRAMRASLIHEYELCSVSQYILPQTNQFGRVTGSSLCYAFTYIDSNGALQTVSQFEHFEYGMTKVCIGESDKYVVDEYTDIEYLYLSKDTLNSIGKG